MVNRILLVVVCAISVFFWIAVLPATVQADTCQERAQYIGTQIVAGNVGNATEADPDCDRGGVVSALIAFGAATATAVIAVTTGLQGAGPSGAAGSSGGAFPTSGGAWSGPNTTYGAPGPAGSSTAPPVPALPPDPPPATTAGPPAPPTAPSGPATQPTTEIVTGDNAIQILHRMGLADPVYDPSDPTKITGYKPASGIDALGGTPTQRTVGEMTDPADPTGKTVTNVQKQTINRVSGIGFNVNPATGQIDPNQIAITVETKPPDPWTTLAPTTPTVTPTTTPPPTTPAGPTATEPPATNTTPPTPPTPPTTTPLTPPATTTVPPTTVPPTTVPPPTTPPATTTPEPPTSTTPPPPSVNQKLPVKDPPDVNPNGQPIFGQERNDTCAIASSRMMINRLTGQDIPEDELTDRATKQGMYHPGRGTLVEGPVDLLNSVDGIKAELRPGMTPEQMQAEIDNGNQVTVGHDWPGDGAHRVVVQHVDVRPDGRSTITFDDPGTCDPIDGQYGVQRTESMEWWQRNGHPKDTIVARKVPVTANGH